MILPVAAFAAVPVAVIEVASIVLATVVLLGA